MAANNVARGTFQITSMNAIQYLVMALFYVVVAKTNALTPTDLGVLSILFFISSTLTLSTFALPTALTKFASEYSGKNQPQKAASVQRTLTKAVVGLSLAGLVIASILSAPLSLHFWEATENVPLIILISISAFLLNLISLYRSGLRALQLFGKMAQVTLVYILTSRIIAVLLALLGLGVFGVTIGYIIGSLIGLGTAIAFVHGRFADPDNGTPIKPLLQFSLPLFLSSLAALILSQADVIILASATSNYALVGIYSVAVRSLLALSVIWQPIMVTIFPAISARFGLQDAEGVTNVVKTASRYLAYTIIPSCVLLATVAPTALNVFYGPDYVSGATALAVLAISIILSALFTLLTTTLTAIGETSQVLRINLISALVAVTLLISLVPMFDVVGAAVTRLVVHAVSLLLAVYLLGQHVRVQLDREALWKSAVAAILSVPFLFLLESMMTKSFPVVQVLTAEILTAGVVYLTALYVLKALNGQDFELLREFFPKPFSKIIDVLQAVMYRE